MDLIRIYTETAFYRVALRFLTGSQEVTTSVGNLQLSGQCFMDEARIHHPELSDDNLGMIYNLGKDDWSHFGYESNTTDEGNIFQVMAFMAKQLCEDTEPFPKVHFKDLFRWREITQLVGEDLVTCALLAFDDRNRTKTNRRFDWPSVLHNDNPHLNYIFERKGLCELHSHLMASTNTFEITWVCLMNHIANKSSKFEKLASKHEQSRLPELSEKLYELVIEAAKQRWLIFQCLVHDDFDAGNLMMNSRPKPESIDSDTDSERLRHCKKQGKKWIPDYISKYPDSPMSVYSGERWLLYSALKRIYAVNDPNLTKTLYRYGLAKSLMRSYFVQLNRNVGFSNFQRYQSIKTSFLEKEYNALVASLPLWESSNHNFTKIFETRIQPVESMSDLSRQIRRITKWTHTQECPVKSENSVIDKYEWALFFHFLKKEDKNFDPDKRNSEVRAKTKEGSRNLESVKEELEARGIDAASSELVCRPEAFGQGFRFLRYYGFDATFHAGEDFFDIADGLRAIDEAITFLDLHASDRIGHAIALGIDADKYYDTRHYTVAMSKQYMLDNAVWLLMKSRELGIAIDTRTEWFLNDTYLKLVKEIGYTDDGGEGFPDIRDYWDSMALRGDNPEIYVDDKSRIIAAKLSPETWDYYAALDNERANAIRRFNLSAVRLYRDYHGNRTVRKNGELVKAFVLTHGYAKLITELQNAMMKMISKRQLCIECCPSSNLRIGRLDRFDAHPIFRFMPVRDKETRYPLAVTVNTDDLGIFSTSLPNEYSLLALALLKKKDAENNDIYSTQEVYDWIERVIDNSHKFTFLRHDKSIQSYK